MDDVNVFGLRIANNPVGYSQVLAYFDCDVRGIRMLGCALLLKNTVILVSGPRLGDRSVRFIESPLAERVKVAALKVFHQFGGELPDIGREIHLPEGVRALLSTSARRSND